MTVPLDIYGRQEVDALLGISRQRVDVIRRTDPRFPAPRVIQHPGEAPKAQLASGPVWDGPALRAYAAQRKRT